MVMYIDRWNMKFPLDENKKVNFSSMIIAPRRSGKTYFINWLLHNPLKNKYDMIFIFTTSSGVSEYKKMNIPLRNVKIYANYMPEVIEMVKKTNTGTDNPANILMIFDDSCSRKQKFDDEILDLYTKGRHFNISIIYSVQTATLVDNIWKDNSDFIFLFKPRTSKQRLYIVENLISGMMDIDFDKISEEKKFYKNVLKAVTDISHTMMIIDMVEQAIFHFKA